jgi:hypothetical protein
LKGGQLESKAVFWLKLSFIIGAAVDALALIPMVVPWVAEIFWGFEDFTGIYYYAMGMGASLMLAWTLLLLWAFRKPQERRMIALLTILIILGIAASEILALSRGDIAVGKLLGTFILQTFLLLLFSYSFAISRKIALEKT